MKISCSSDSAVNAQVHNWTEKCVEFRHPIITRIHFVKEDWLHCITRSWSKLKPIRKVDKRLQIYRQTKDSDLGAFACVTQYWCRPEKNIGKQQSSTKQTKHLYIDIKVTYADLVLGVGRLYTLYVCVYVCVYVSTLKQKPLYVSSPNLAGG